MSTSACKPACSASSASAATSRSAPGTTSDDRRGEVARSRIGYALLAALGALGCGARTELAQPTQGRDGTGASSSAASSTASGGGAGGSNPHCPLVPRDEIRSFDSYRGAFGHTPALSATSVDGEQVTLVVRSEPEPVPIDASPLITQVTFRPWAAWSMQPLGVELVVTDGYDFVAPRTREDGLYLWIYRAAFATGPNMFLVEGAPTHIAQPGGRLLLTITARPAFVTGSIGDVMGLGDGVGIGYAEPFRGLELGNILLATPLSVVLAFSAQCDGSPFFMDGMRSGEAVLAAVARSEPPFCNSASFVDIVHRADDITSVMQAVDAQPSIVQLQMVPRSDGAWVVWQRGDAETSGPLEAIRTNTLGQPISEPMVLVPDGTIFETVALATLGDDLAVAYKDNFDPSAPTFIVMVFDVGGAPIMEGSLSPGSWARPGERYALLGAPSGESLLLAWSSATADSTVVGTSQVYTARFDCAR